MDNTELLINTKNKDLEEFTLNNLKTECKVVDIYDADTCKIIFFFNNKLVKFNCRLENIDTPELRPSKKNPNRILEKIAAQRARNRLIQLCTDIKITLEEKLTRKKKKNIMDQNKKILILECKEFDKYGRLLISLNCQKNGCINQILVKEGFANEYFGGKKKEFTFNKIPEIESDTESDDEIN